MLSNLPYASFLVYSPCGTSPVSRESQRICYAVKQDGPQTNGGPIIEAVVKALAKGYAGGFADFLGPDVTLVPVPKSAPNPKGTSPFLWVPRRICEVLVAAGLGRAIVPCVERVTAVAKSASAGPGGRPNVNQHIGSMQARLELAGGRVTLVDDVVTKGATLIAAANVLANAFTDVDVRGFSLIRTLGFVPDVTQVIDPAVGVITRDRWGNADRNP